MRKDANYHNNSSGPHFALFLSFESACPYTIQDSGLFAVDLHPYQRVSLFPDASGAHEASLLKSERIFVNHWLAAAALASVKSLRHLFILTNGPLRYSMGFSKFFLTKRQVLASSKYYCYHCLCYSYQLSLRSASILPVQVSYLSAVPYRIFVLRLLPLYLRPY